ncbi:protein of unknown function DUF47 [Alicyclobacillus hesperidum URH17-3-68]|uniref:Phosphate transport regulator n=1 Tax=Alicyclobacillus hesperidum TaxID=89784 RepID=A0A1H2WXZ4_9BACL|nr:DUF47 family protein [Alicyclobacillus hesperidum]KRW91387.1 phosphate transport regulator [Alicyclobacillus tengchongensis]EJY54976.1 protein of unknown function DUF47 [Alicyclobacillus hesperidum URH17-3-68]SDW85482.1 hypothetical protein SAMN04489725_11736 [Alicyclobacillus hesperidum]GLG02676.1 hypothetical protein Alches_27170 [Alicyclobacillus hesperidum subsp. aegles]GLV13017.1 hypothetical protein Heshes_07010 [Alicyclobacillus hesperidum]
MSKRSDQLFTYLVDIADNIEVATKTFHNELSEGADFGALANQMKAYEDKGDDLISKLISLLNNTYITPLEREDFVTLAVTLDDIIDGIHACSVRFTLYDVNGTTPTMVEFAKDIHASAVEIAQAIRKLNERKLLHIREHIKQLNVLEKHGDQLLHAALRSLFAECSDAIELIKLKEIYEILENVTDRCEDVADVLESVILKNA